MLWGVESVEEFERTERVMKITLKLYASFGQYLPSGARNNTILISVADNISVHAVLDIYGVPLREAHLVVVNGVFVCESERDTHLLKASDTLAVWPAVAGG